MRLEDGLPWSRLLELSERGLIACFGTDTTFFVSRIPFFESMTLISVGH